MDYLFDFFYVGYASQFCKLKCPQLHITNACDFEMAGSNNRS